MKKTIIYSCLLAVLTIFISCGTTKEVQSTPDSYINEDEITPALEENAESSTGTKKTNAGRKKKNAIEDFFTLGNKDDYIIYDDTTVFSKELSGMKEKKAKMVIRYDNHMAGFGSFNSGVFYYVQFDAENRKKFANAVNKYFDDFENKRLQRNGRHTERTYGKISYMINWGQISSLTPANGTGEGYCGYEFEKGSPYFTISNFPFKNDYYERAGDATSRESPSLKYYFTRSQLKKLLELMSEETIAKQIAENDFDYSTIPTEADEY